jgi:hypothetical protein
MIKIIGNAGGGSQGAKIILNGNNGGGGNISFLNDNTTACVMNSSGVTMNGNSTLQADKWIFSSDITRQRFFFGSDGATCCQGYGASSWFDMNHEWRSSDGTKTMHLDYSGNLIVRGILNCKFYTVTNTNRVSDSRFNRNSA